MIDTWGGMLSQDDTTYIYIYMYIYIYIQDAKPHDEEEKSKSIKMVHWAVIISTRFFTRHPPTPPIAHLPWSGMVEIFLVYGIREWTFIELACTYPRTHKGVGQCFPEDRSLQRYNDATNTTTLVHQHHDVASMYRLNENCHSRRRPPLQVHAFVVKYVPYI